MSLQLRAASLTTPLRTGSMTGPLRLALLAITAAVLMTSLIQGTPEGRLLAARVLGPDLREVELLGLSTAERRVPARMTERVRADLVGAPRVGGAAPVYVPDPDQGQRFVTDSGLRWWGAGPDGSEPRPAIILLHAQGRDGRSMVDMWHEAAQNAGLVLIAPDLTPVEGEVGPYDARVAIEALMQAQEVYAIDARRIALFGHGEGAVAAQTWANRLDGPWRAVAAHGATVGLDMPQPVAEGVPVRLYLGSEHPGEPMGQALAAGTAMARAGHPFELIRMRGHDDWFYDVGERVAADAWLWLSERLDPSAAR